MDYYQIEFNIFHIGIVIVLIYLLVYLILSNRVKCLESRIGKYCVHNKKRSPILNYIYCLYKGIVRSISLFLMKIPTFSIYIKQYEKYITKENKNIVIPADFISNKILVSILFFLIITNVRKIDGNIITDFEIILVVLFGYCIPDIYNMIKYNRKL